MQGKFKTFVPNPNIANLTIFLPIGYVTFSDLTRINEKNKNAYYQVNNHHANYIFTAKKEKKKSRLFVMQPIAISDLMHISVILKCFQCI